MNLDGIVIQNYIYHFFKEMERSYTFTNKTVMFIHCSPDIENAKALIKLGAKEVFFVNPEYTFTKTENNSITLLNEKEFYKINDNSADIIIGFEILEHINYLDSFFKEIKRILKNDGVAELRGYPIWTHPLGHHIYIPEKYIFNQDTNPFEPWEHLIYDNKEEMKNALMTKGYSEYDAFEITNWIYNKSEISRCTPTEIIEAASGILENGEIGGFSYTKYAMYDVYKSDNFIVKAKRAYNCNKQNEFFNIAKNKYKECDLRTENLIIKIFKISSKQQSETDCSNKNNHLLSTLFENLLQNNKIDNATVLNISEFEHKKVSEFLKNLGAKTIVSVHPNNEIESTDYIDGVQEYKMSFDEFYNSEQKFDIIVGINNLDSIFNIDSYREQIKKLQQIAPVVYLTGFTPYTSACGHKIYTEKYHFTDETNPLQPWEHLMYESKEDFFNAFAQKGFNQQDINEISYFINGKFSPTDLLQLSVKDTDKPVSKSFAVSDYQMIEILQNENQVYKLTRNFQEIQPNEFYDKAKTKYSEFDLKTGIYTLEINEKTTNTDDNFDINNISKPVSDVFIPFKEKYDIKDKNILNISSLENETISKLFLACGAKSVTSVSPNAKISKNYYLDNLFEYQMNFDEFDMSDKSFDIIFGLNVLDNNDFLSKLQENIMSYKKASNVVCLTAYTPFSSCFGHKFYNDKYHFIDETNPFEYWEHLQYNSFNEAKNALIQKGIPEENALIIADSIYNKNKICRYSPSELLEVIIGNKLEQISGSTISTELEVKEQYIFDDYTYRVNRHFEKFKQNKFFKTALKKYDTKDLLTGLFTVTIEKNKKPPIKTELINLSEVHHSITDIIIPFNARHNFKDKNVLNLSCYEQSLLTKIFLQLGAKSVTEINPSINIDEQNFINNVHQYKMFFEEFDTNKKQFDIVIGLNTVDNIRNIDKFCQNLKAVTNENTSIYISGFTPYTSACGHKVYTDNHRYIDDTNPFEYWEHLNIKSKEEFIEKLKQKNIPQDEIDLIIYRYFDLNLTLKYSPTELEKKFKEFLNVCMYKIFKYLPKNSFYNEALKIYSEDDLNVERMIITSDIPQETWIDELNLDTYLVANLSDINMKYRFANKRILNVTPFIQNLITEGLEAFKPKEVVSMGSHYSGFEIRGGQNVRRVNQNLEDLANLTGKFDIIYGLDVLEHIKDVKTFFINLKNLVSDTGVICLQGSPLWPSNNGHNYAYTNLDCGTLKTGEGFPCLEPWEHLAYTNAEDMKKAMIAKGFTEHDADIVSDYVFNSDEINRLSYIDFINILNEIDGIYFGSKKILHYTEDNEFYKKANEKYTHEELRTKELKLFIRKKLS